jgi:hypothetical protein
VEIDGGEGGAVGWGRGGAEVVGTHRGRGGQGGEEVVGEAEGEALAFFLCGGVERGGGHGESEERLKQKDRSTERQRTERQSC